MYSYHDSPSRCYKTWGMAVEMTAASTMRDMSQGTVHTLAKVVMLMHLARGIWPAERLVGQKSKVSQPCFRGPLGLAPSPQAELITIDFTYILP